MNVPRDCHVGQRRIPQRAEMGIHQQRGEIAGDMQSLWMGGVRARQPRQQGDPHGVALAVLYPTRRPRVRP